MRGQPEAAARSELYCLSQCLAKSRCRFPITVYGMKKTIEWGSPPCIWQESTMSGHSPKNRGLSPNIADAVVPGSHGKTRTGPGGRWRIAPRCLP